VLTSFAVVPAPATASLVGGIALISSTRRRRA
jgi:hypothetical protein